MNIETILGVVASVCTATALLPQLIKIVKEKKADTISMGTMITLFVGLSLWVAYGFLKEDLIIILSNATSFIINLLILILSYKYKR